MRYKNMALGAKPKMAVAKNGSIGVVDQTRSYQARQKTKLSSWFPQGPEPITTVLAKVSSRLPEQTEIPLIRTLCLVTVTWQLVSVNDWIRFPYCGNEPEEESSAGKQRVEGCLGDRSEKDYGHHIGPQRADGGRGKRHLVLIWRNHQKSSGGQPGICWLTAPELPWGSHHRNPRDTTERISDEGVCR
jgi:hypothetical protein